MSITSLEVKDYRLRKSLIGYDTSDVSALKELCTEALAEGAKEMARLREENLLLTAKLEEHEKRESILKDTITTAQKMVDDLKINARKEAELLVAEARHRAEEISSLVSKRVAEIQHEIIDLKRKRKELETTLRSALEYHLSILDMESKEANKKDEEAEKVKYMPK